jgi:hypothetical protein
MAGSGCFAAASHPFCRGVKFSVFRISQVTDGQQQRDSFRRSFGSGTGVV